MDNIVEGFKNKKIVNQVNNNRIKEHIIKNSIRLLKDQNKITDKETLNYTEEFGYLFNEINDDKLEGLYKIKIEEQEFYFAIQGAKIILLNIDETLYRTNVALMEDLWNLK